MNPNADPRMATVLSGISRLVSDFGDQGALTLILQNDAGKALLDSMHNVSRAASMLEKGPPIPLFAMTGPTGVGKTELAKTLASFFFGSDDSMVRLDMSEYMERHNVSKLIGL